jgi:hypothetical protein
LLLVIAAFALGRAFFVAKLRYRLPVEPALALFAAFGASALLGLLRSRHPKPAPARAVAAAEPIELVSADRL